MIQVLDDATSAPPADGPPQGGDNDGLDPRSVEKLLLGSVAAFMVVWLALLGWLFWWLFT